MGARVSSVRSAVPAGRAFPFELASGQLETLKWLAFVCMIVAHSYRHVFGGSEGWPIEVGRICFPIFALCVAIPLSRSPAGRGARMAFGLAGFAVAAQLIGQPLRDGAALNVLFLFLSAGAWLAVDPAPAGERLAVRVLALGVAFLAEFSLPGLALILSLVRAYQRGSVLWWTWACVWLVLSGILEGSAWNLAVFAVVPLVASTRVGFAQVRRLFPALYVSQYIVFWIARAIT